MDQTRAVLDFHLNSPSVSQHLLFTSTSLPLKLLTSQNQSNMNSKRSSRTDKEISMGAGPSWSALSEVLQQVSVPADTDQAYEFLSSTQVSAAQVLAVDLSSLRRRVDYRLVPFMWLCYTMCWLDKAILNVSELIERQTCSSLTFHSSTLQSWAYTVICT